MKTKNVILIFFALITISVSAQKKSKLDFETGIGLGWEGDYGLVGMNQYNTLIYNLSDNFSLSGNFGFFQSLNFRDEFNSNSSSLLLDLDVNYSLLNRNKNSLIIGAGVTYFKGVLAYDDGTLPNPRHNVDYYNSIGLNCMLKYKYNISEKWSGNIAIRTYLMDPTTLLLSYSTISYGFSYSF